MENICYNCFSDSLNDAGICEKCGFNGAENREKYPLALPLGSILYGRYIVGRVLGQGGFGITYLAQDYQTKGLVAIKEFFPDSMATRTEKITVCPLSGERGENFAYGLNSFLEEAKTMAEFIGNPNITRVDCYFEENGTGYFVMEYLDGDSFLDYIKSHGGRLGWEDTMRVALPIMDALAAMHEKGIIHRDVTPDNIYITKDGTVKLLDFGAARYSLGNVSRSLDVILKHGFAPKEQYSRRGKQGPFTDVYSLGATIYYALTGVKPDDAIERLEEDQTPLPTTLGARISNSQEAVVMRALAVMPYDRYQNIPQFRAAILSAKPLPKPKPKPEPTPEPKPKKELPKWLLPGMAAVLAVAVGAGIWVMKPSMDYKAALERMDAGEYDSAAEAFSELGNYKDSPQKAEDAVHEKAYQKAWALLDSEEYDQAAEAFKALGAYKDSAQKVKDAMQGKADQETYGKARTLMDAGEYAKAMILFSKLNYKDSADQLQKAMEAYWISQRASLVVGAGHTVGLRSDGTVVAAGSNEYGQCDVSSWTDIVAVDAGYMHTVGLRSDGTVVATEITNNNGDMGEREIDYGQCNVSSWTDIVAVAVGWYHTVALRSDGTVVATGANWSGQCDVSGWTDIVAVAAGPEHTVGLRSDGTVVAEGNNKYGRCNVSSWTDIVAVAVGWYHTVALRSDGTVVATGYNDDGRCDVSSWTDIVAVATGPAHTVGLRSDGTVVAVGSNEYGRCNVSSWTDIVAVAAGEDTIGLRSDGTTIASGWNSDIKLHVDKWTGILVP
ncbi:MAG: protein kinase [Clostridiales bacterium]|nr:protein kinase [Clostridiales bacterium]